MNENIRKLSWHDPVIYAAIGLYDIGKCTYEEALEYAVLALAEQKNKLTDKLTKAMRESCPSTEASRGTSTCP